ncbi:MAG: hypothetical protein PHF86_15100 [Candidatus Nanoarchaeia archaeon]|nr:hypothetical protein [Candidatus Nanoarchaeia archaeon]
MLDKRFYFMLILIFFIIFINIVILHNLREIRINQFTFNDKLKTYLDSKIDRYVLSTEEINDNEKLKVIEGEKNLTVVESSNILDVNDIRKKA